MNYKNVTRLSAIVLVLQIGAFLWAGVPLFDQYVALKLSFISLVSICLGFIISYIFWDNKRVFTSSVDDEGMNWRIFFSFLIVVSYFPLIISSYFWHDDYLNYHGYHVDFFSFSISTGRIGAALYVELFNWMTVETSYYARSVGVLGVLFFFLLFNRWMLELGYGNRTSLIIPFLCSVSLPLINIGAYAMEYSFIWGGLFSAFSVIAFIRSLDYFSSKAMRDFTVHFIVALVCVIVALFIYQATTTVGLALVMVYLLSACKVRNQILREVFLYYIFFGASTVLYLAMIRAIGALYQISLINRAELVSSISEAIQKSIWFMTFVFPQGVRQMVFMFGGGQFFTQEWSLITLEYKSLALGYLIEGSLVVIFILGYWLGRRRYSETNYPVLTNSLTFILLLGAIPYSYFYLLVAKENSYLTFYVSGLVFLLLSIVALCLRNILFAWNPNDVILRKIFIFIIVPILTLVAFNNNRYLQEIWVRPNDISYHFVKKNLEKNLPDSKRVHIIGASGEVDVYWIRAAQMALLELGQVSTEYDISYSDNEYYVSAVESRRFDEFSQMLNPDEMTYLQSFYEKNQSFGYYYLKTQGIQQADLEKLQHIFRELNVIPTDDTAIVIDMRVVQ